jgi:hypothetical protein
METATTIRPDQVDTPTFLPPADCGEAAFPMNGFMALPRITSDDDVGFVRTTLMRLFAKKAGRSEGMLLILPARMRRVAQPDCHNSWIHGISRRNF